VNKDLMDISGLGITAATFAASVKIAAGAGGSSVHSSFAAGGQRPAGQILRPKSTRENQGSRVALGASRIRRTSPALGRAAVPGAHRPHTESQATTDMHATLE
jgi:hypothetical protein